MNAEQSLRQAQWAQRAIDQFGYLVVSALYHHEPGTVIDCMKFSPPFEGTMVVIEPTTQEEFLEQTAVLFSPIISALAAAQTKDRFFYRAKAE